MPCEGCNIQFTVFRRKRPCSECRRYFCNHCLTKRNQNILCERCVIFAKRPLTRADLLNLKPKDLIFYLQSKHISTTGCVEKEELVNLILANTDVGSIPSNTQNEQRQSSPSNDDSENCTNPFDQLKQTCQNLFSSFTDRISSDLGFDSKQATSPTLSNSNCNFYDATSGIITREIPTYSESINRNIETGDNSGQRRQQTGVNRPTNLVPNTTAATTTTHNINYLSPNAPNASSDVFSSASGPSSPINSISSISSNSISSQAINQSSNQRNQAQNINNNNDGNISSTSSSLQTRTHQIESTGIATVHKSVNNRKIFKNVLPADGNGSGCDCSDDEIITKYNTRQRSVKPIHDQLQSSLSPSQKIKVEEKSSVDKCSPTSQSDSAFEDQIAGPNGSTAESSDSNSKSLSEDNQVKSSEGSSGSSFEELGAVGGGGGCTSTSSDNENWQMVNKVEISPYSTFTRRTTEVNDWYKAGAPGPSRLFTDRGDCDIDAFLSYSNISNLTGRPVGNRPSNKHYQEPQQKAARRITRRRSDSYIYNQNQQNTLSELESSVFQQLDEESDEGEHDEIKSRKRVKKSCKKCGKSKKSIEGQVDKFRQQLESSQLSADEIRQELARFVEYLEQRAKSFDGSDDSETNHEQETEDNSVGNSSRQSEEYEAEENNDSSRPLPTQPQSSSSLSDNLPEIIIPEAFYHNSDDGIHVYAPEEARTYQQQQRFKHDPRFINLIDYKSSAELDDLSVKQLKEILLLNRVDFKGCCEKQELLDRVKRLWKELHSCPEIEKLPADDLCKICMDAPIECVILECGHMATCTNCGKVLNECPICRQYIVRVVRFFRA